MLHIRACAICVIALVSPATTDAGGVKLDLREYKLMLRPETFAGPNQRQTVNQFWSGHLVPIIAGLGPKKNGEARHKGEFEPEPERQVIFRDTPECALKENGLVLRERIKLKDDKPDWEHRKATLKFRTPDIFLATAADFAAVDANAKVKQEEDISPLVVFIEADGTRTAEFARPPSIRSLFARSVSQDLEAIAGLNTFGEAEELFPGLSVSIQVGAPAARTPLIAGDAFYDRVYGGAVVDLGDTDGEFEITLWHRDASSSSEPEVAELSFKYATRQGDVDGDVARRALTLFALMQKKLTGWTDPDHETKTSIGLPKDCKG